MAKDNPRARRLGEQIQRELTELLRREVKDALAYVRLAMFPDDDVALTGKSKAVWQESERRGRQTRLEPATLASFAALYAFPRWLTALGEALPPGQPLPNLADVLQERCEKLLEQVCMPVCP